MHIAQRLTTTFSLGFTVPVSITLVLLYVFLCSLFVCLFGQKAIAAVIEIDLIIVADCIKLN